MNIYCVMREEARSDLDHVVYATTNKDDAERFAHDYDFIDYDGNPNIEVLDVVESEDIDICEKYGCEMDWEHEECEFWEDNGKEKWIPIADAIPEEMERLREEACGEKKDPWEDKTE